MPSPRNKVIDLGPSASHRWSTCTASPQFIVDNWEKLPDGSSSFADEGTVAHSVAAALLLKRPAPADTPAEMLGHAGGFRDFVLTGFEEGDILEVETKLPLFYLPSRNGIVDAAVMAPDRVAISDLKYGVGVSVEADRNTQLAIYAESLIQRWEMISTFDKDMPVDLSIYQPRDRNNPEPVRTWSLTRGDLGVFASGLSDRAREIQSGKVEFKPSTTACKFCPAKGLCSAYANEGLVALPPEARIIELPHPGTLSREQRIKVLKAKKVLGDWLEAVEDQEVSELMAGAEPMGMKLVEGKSNREWKDEDAASTLLSNHLSYDEMHPRKPLISPHAAEVLLKGATLSTRFTNRMGKLITKPEGKPTLVTEDDHRQALDFSPENQLTRLGDI